MALRVLSLCAAAAVLGACSAPRAALAPTPAGPFAVIDARSQQRLTIDETARRVRSARAVFFGEFHDDAGAHRAQLALLQALASANVPVIVSMEMFERDVQGTLSSYLAGTLSDSAFRATSRPWPNYAADYRPVVELAKAQRWPVIAANTPRRLASAVSRGGLKVLDTLPAADRAHVASDLACSTAGEYYTRFAAVMGEGAAGHGGGDARAMVDRFYAAQCIKDETMAESIVRALTGAPANTVLVHLNGAFHSDFGLGTVERVRRRLPDARLSVLSATPMPVGTMVVPDSVRARGDFIVVTFTKP